jgi:hypothetical protein
MKLCFVSVNGPWETHFGSGQTSIKLILSANKVGLDKSLITAGKSLIYNKKNNGSRIDH